MGPLTDGNSLCGLHFKTRQSGSAGKANISFRGQIDLPGRPRHIRRCIQGGDNRLILQRLRIHPEFEGIAAMVIDNDMRNLDFGELRRIFSTFIPMKKPPLGQGNEHALPKTGPSREFQSTAKTPRAIIRGHVPIDRIDCHILRQNNGFIRFIKSHPQQRIIIRLRRRFKRFLRMQKRPVEAKRYNKEQAHPMERSGKFCFFHGADSFIKLEWFSSKEPED